jgi:hypothetical protein
VTRLTVRVISLLAALSLGLLTVVVFPRDAYACSCTQVARDSAADRADAIFEGTVVAKSNERKPAPGRTDIRFNVSRVYKGSVYQQQVVASPHSSDGCGIDPDLNSSWVIFAEDRIEGSGDDAVLRLSTELCSGNIPGGQAPTTLGRGRSPLTGASDREERAAATDATVTGALKAGGIVGLALVALAGVGLAVLWRPGRQAG